MKPPRHRSPKTRSIKERLVDGYKWLDKEVECGMLDLGLFVRGERRVVTAEMILVFLVQLIMIVVVIAGMMLWGMVLRYFGIHR